MSTIAPLRAIRYSTPPGKSDVTTRLAPPYDVLDQQQKQALLGRDPRNFVRVDLPVVPAKSAGPPQVYQAAARQIEDWLQDGTLIRDPQPGLYVYCQRFRHEDRDFLRRMFFARLRLEPLGSGSVFPHEQTFGGPKEDRLCLTQATRMNLSPIFGVYQDPKNAVAGVLAGAARGAPLASGTVDQVENQLWAITDAEVIRDVATMMVSKPTYIADGHHRYGTSLLYRDWLAQQQGPLANNHPAHFVLCVFCAMEDPGLLILPTHRVLPRKALSPQTLAEDPKLDLTPLSQLDPDQVIRELAKFGPQALALYSAQQDAYTVVRPKNPDILDDIEPSKGEAWRGLALAFLHSYLLPRAAGLAGGGEKSPEIEYVKAAQAAVQTAKASGGSAFLLQPTTMDELRSVCQAGELMPQKSTFFYPKLASGLVISSLNDE